MTNPSIPGSPGPGDDINYEVHYDDGVSMRRKKHESQMRFYKNTTDFAHILGNVTEIIKQYVYQTMSRNIFKGTRVTTEEAFKDFTNKSRDFIQLERPFLVIDPKLDMNQESDSLPWWVWDRFIQIDQSQPNPNFYLMNHEWFMTPQDNSFYLGYTIARHKIQLNMSIIVDSGQQAYSMQNYLKTNFRMRAYYPLPRYTETIIPKSYIKYIAKKWNMSLNSDDFLKALNRISEYTILRLNRPSTDTTEFFILQKQNIQIRIPDYPESEKVMVNRVQKYSIIRFTMETELNIMNNFILLADEEIENTEMMSDYTVRISMQSRAPIIPTVVDKYSMYFKITCEFDKPQDVINLNDYLSHDTLPLIKYIQDNDLADDYVMIKMYRWEEEVDNTDNKVFSFDPSTFEMKVFSAEPEVMYNIAIFFDNNYLARIKTYVTPVNFMGDEIRQGNWNKEDPKILPPSPMPRDTNE